MAIGTNVFEKVELYRDSGLAFMHNSYPLINRMNKKLAEFDRITGNLGDSITYSLFPKFFAQDGLTVGVTNDAVQRVRTLVADKKKHVAFDFSAEQYIFNARDYMDGFGKAAMIGLGDQIEADVETIAVKHTHQYFDFRGTGNLSFRNLAEANVKYRTRGSAGGTLEVYLPDNTIPSIVDAGQFQFTLNRNNENAMSWEIGSMNKAEYFSCNLLPLQISGQASDSNSADTLVFGSINPAGDQITFTGATDDANSINENDLIVFSKDTGLRFLTQTGGAVSSVEVSVRATAVAAAVAGSVTVSIEPALVSITVDPLDANSNINQPLTVADTATVIGDHRAGMIIAERAAFMAMNELNDMTPFPSYSKRDPRSGATIRMYYGAFLGSNRNMTVYDTIYGYDLDPERCMRLVFPV